MASSYAPTANRALSYFTERAEDAQAAIMGILGGASPGGAVGPSGADRYLTEVDLGAGEQGVRSTRAKLESSAEVERLQGLRTVVAMISKSLPAADHLFPSVLKLTSAQSLQVRTLVYLVTLRLAPSQPDIALLSINSFQRDLSDASPLIRGMALRVLSGLGVKMASTIMEMAIAKGVRDASFYVRRIAADAIGKCYELSRNRLPALLPHLSTLLADRHPSVLGSALLALNCTAPDRYDLLHPHFRRICHALVDIDEWNQPVSLRILASYARVNLRQPTEEQAKAIDDGSAEKKVTARTRWGTGLDPDLDLLLTKAEPLLASRNTATVLSAAHLLLSLLPAASPALKRLVQPLLRLLQAPSSQAYVAVLFIRSAHATRPDLFAEHSSAFVPSSTIAGEPVYLTQAKLDVLVDIAVSGGSEAATELAIDELEEAALHRFEPAVREHAIRGLGRVARAALNRNLGTAEVERCTKILLAVIKAMASVEQDSPRSAVEGAVGVLRDVLHSQLSSTSSAPSTDAAVHVTPSGGPSDQQVAAAEVVYSLCNMLFRSSDKLSTTSAPKTEREQEHLRSKLVGKSCLANRQGRASVFWLVGHYCRAKVRARVRGSSANANDNVNDVVHMKTLAETTLPDVLRKAALHFDRESQGGKLAILGFSSKLYTFLCGGNSESTVTESTQQAVAQLHSYILQLGKYDAAIAVRDRARFLKSLTSGMQGPEAGAESIPGGDDHVSNDEGPAAGGVRLRREQVMKVLFDDVGVPSADVPPNSGKGKDQECTGSNKDSSTNDMWAILDPFTLATVASASQPHSNRKRPTYDAAKQRLPPWTPPNSERPPASVRDVDPQVVTSAAKATGGGNNSRLQVGGLAAGATVKSLSSDDFTSHALASGGGAGVTSSGRASVASLTPVGSSGDLQRGHLTNAAGPPEGGKGKFRDLDAFLDAESSSSESDDGASEGVEGAVSVSSEEESEDEEDQDEVFSSEGEDVGTTDEGSDSGSSEGDEDPASGAAEDKPLVLSNDWT